MKKKTGKQNNVFLIMYKNNKRLHFFNDKNEAFD